MGLLDKLLRRKQARPLVSAVEARPRSVFRSNPVLAPIELAEVTPTNADDRARHLPAPAKRNPLIGSSALLAEISSNPDGDKTWATCCPCFASMLSPA